MAQRHRHYKFTARTHFAGARAPLSRGLFSRAMLLSGACTAMSRTRAERGGLAAASHLGCTAEAAACMRARSVEEIVAVPINDGRATSAVIAGTDAHVCGTLSPALRIASGHTLRELPTGRSVNVSRGHPWREGDASHRRRDETAVRGLDHGRVTAKPPSGCKLGFAS